MYEPGYLWDVKDRLIKEVEMQVMERRSIDPSHEFF
jgi:hypothetical protein